MSFSNSSGGTLALPSPTHAHQIDVSSAVRGLRRSLSRSPSKFLSRANSHSTEGSRQASPQSPCRRFGSTPHAQQLPLPTASYSAPPAAASMHASTSSSQQPSIIFTPIRSSVKLSLRSAKAKTASPSRPLARTRVSPKSPLKRALNAAADAGNSLHASIALIEQIAGQENVTISRSPATRRNTDKPSTRHSLHVDVSGAGSQYAFLRNIDNNNTDSSNVSTTGALKRSDATMNLDQPSQGSPVAKRRSMHGITSLVPTPLNQVNNTQVEDLGSIFGSTPAPSQSFEIHEDSHSEYELSGASAPTLREQFLSPTLSSNLPKRSSSLRKSTLQQRYGDKSSFGRRMGERQLAQMSMDPSSPARSRPRLSSDHFTPPSASRESPFTSNPTTTPQADSKSHQPHPLSKTLTTSSSGNSLTEEVSMYAPAKFADRPRAHPFARSLPVNAMRPTARGPADPSIVATPNHSDKLWTPAFHSTGLISKVNRNPEEDADRKMAPPDTPCKKHSNPFATFPPPAGSAMKKKNNNRNSFAGLPSTPFNPSLSNVPDTFGNPGKGLGIFQRGSAGRRSRRSSFLKLDGEVEERKLFGELVDFSNPDDAPPTPTKNTLTPSFSNLSNVSETSIDSPSANRTSMLPMSAVKPAVSRQSTASPVSGRRTPQTPQESALPLDTSRLSLSHTADGLGDSIMAPPVTPTAGRDFRSSTSHFVTPVNMRTSNIDIDASLYSRFDKIEQIGKGEFSTVYRVTTFGHLCAADAVSTTPGQDLSRSPTKGQIFAVKKTKTAYIGPKDREEKLREARILKKLSHAEHVVRYIDDWEHNCHLYIQTEFCEEGTLYKFLSNVGRDGRLDDFRIFKILHDLCSGLKEIHDAGFMHLDMKPANILITFEGAVKIGDFGLAQPCDSQAGGVDVEGDREYMAPEMLHGKSGKPADIFSVGLIILEAAANVVLPNGGPTWIALRSGDLSEVPSLTWNFSSIVERDALEDGTGLESLSEFSMDAAKGSSSLFGSLKRQQAKQQQPDFMVNPLNVSSLDSIVRWMTSQDPADRPTADMILELEGLKHVAKHRNAPATVYEGTWGPSEPFAAPIEIDSDTEMTGV
ncbi:hypothetical protein B0I35DRAFT_347281 [Stachybotrys elegans]|uniref:Protein kinase domain-containing protein n=1 Tax=Stachybotrys elegans TaxID=80388 RepID=A0A8K0WV80_9HYPO|nr:hypothetical protein B0I35DRAFT_347281 [Stachybotrys elegans]